MQRERVGEQTTMTSPPERLAAQERECLAPCKNLELADRGPTLGRVHVVGIGLEGGDPPGRMARRHGSASSPATERFAPPRVPDPDLGKRPAECISTKLRVPARAREATHIDHALDSCSGRRLRGPAPIGFNRRTDRSLQRREELAGGPCSVTDRKHCGAHAESMRNGTRGARERPVFVNIQHRRGHQRVFALAARWQRPAS